MKNWSMTSGTTTSLFQGGFNQNLPGQPNRYANLNPAVWTAILTHHPASLSGAATAPSGQALSPLGVYTELSGYYSGNFSQLDSNATAPRVMQLAVKFYF